MVTKVFSITHQLTSFQGLHQLSVLTGENGPGQVQHHAHCREEHEKGDLEKKTPNPIITHFKRQTRKKYNLDVQELPACHTITWMATFDVF